MIIKPTLENFTRHHFSRDLAGAYGAMTGYGIEAAILLTDIGRNIVSINKYRKENKGWYYTTLDELASRHPYISRPTISRTLVKLRKDGVLLAKNLNKRKYDKTLWYCFADPDELKLAAGKESNISYVVADAVKYGIEAAIILSNVTYWTRYGMQHHDISWLDLEYTTLNPSDLDERSEVNLPMPAWTVRRALKTLVAGGALERRPRLVKHRATHPGIEVGKGWDGKPAVWSKDKWNVRPGEYEYRLVETRHALVVKPDDNYPTERNPHVGDDVTITNQPLY